MKNSKFCGNKKVLSGAWRSEEEWSCPNTGDGCNGILSLNDAHRGQRVITSSQLVYQPERDGEKKGQEEDPATSRPALLPFRVVSTLAWVFNLLPNELCLMGFTSHHGSGAKGTKKVINRLSNSASAFTPRGVTFTLWRCEIFEFYDIRVKYSLLTLSISQHTNPKLWFWAD